MCHLPSAASDREDLPDVASDDDVVCRYGGEKLAVIEGADAEFYRAKSEGQNRVFIKLA